MTTLQGGSKEISESYKTEEIYLLVMTRARGKFCCGKSLRSGAVFFFVCLYFATGWPVFCLLVFWGSHCKLSSLETSRFCPSLNYWDCLWVRDFILQEKVLRDLRKID